MLIILYIAVYVLLNAYVIWRALRWFRHCDNLKFANWKFRTAYITVFCIFAALIIVAYFIHADNMAWFERLSSRWFGILLYIIFYVAVADLIRVIIKLIPKVPKDFFTRRKIVIPCGIVVIILIASTSIYGFVHVDNLQTKYYDATVAKDAGDVDALRVILVADHHLGYIFGVDYMEEMVEAINKQKPDLVVFAGDLFDNEYEAIDDPEGVSAAWAKIDSTYGTYGCWGNHDVTEPLFSGFAVGLRRDALRDPRWDRMVDDANITMLNDESVLIDDSFYLLGRKDYAKTGDGTNNRKTIEEMMEGIDLSKPVLLMDHEPRELQEISDAGVDIDLSGHTHDGQMFPMNYTNRIVFENNYGVMMKGDMYSIVTSGIGVYGPAMRVGTDSEIVVIDVTFSK